MLDLRLTFDITPAFAKAIGDIADAICKKSVISLVDGGRCEAFSDTFRCPAKGADFCAQAAPESPETVEADNSTPEPESAPQAQTSRESTTVPEPEPEAASAEPVEAPKPKRGRSRKADAAQKDAQTAPENAEAVEADKSTPEPESAPQVQTSCEPVAAPEPQAEPVAAPAPAPAPAPKPSGDSYGGMPLLQAVQAMLDEVAQRGIELADVNARVRQAATERGLPYTSAACLMKAIGYDETRKIVLGE